MAWAVAISLSPFFALYGDEQSIGFRTGTGETNFDFVHVVHIAITPSPWRWQSSTLHANHWLRACSAAPRT
jgi:hypothetical protein